MSLKKLKFLFIDCQTTAMRPSMGQVIEFAWSIGTLETPGPVVSKLVKLQGGERIPRAVSNITGLTDEDLAKGGTEEEVFLEFQKALRDVSGPVCCVIHYASFEKAFLTDWFARFAETPELPFEILCSHQLAKKALPHLPSQNLKAAAGFFGEPVSDHNRAGPHVSATIAVWRALAEEFEKLGLFEPQAIREWAKRKPSAQKKIEYRVDKLKRLELPDRPGVYRMLSKSGEVLYVGKATSLKSRVNSYFRGIKNRNRRKLELMAQVWDLDVTPCDSPLEAALLESDEIKRLDPPYNVVFKRGDRRLSFYSRDFLKVSHEQSEEFPLGPFRGGGHLDSLRMLFRCVQTNEFTLPVFYLEIPEETFREGYAQFLRNNKMSENDLSTLRKFLAFGMNLYRHYVEPLEEEAAVEEDLNEEDLGEETEHIYTPDEIAGKIERLCRRSAAEYRRARQMTELLDAEVEWGENFAHRLSLKHGQLRRGPIETDVPEVQSPLPWSDLNIDTYDRLSILLSELNKHPHRTSKHRGHFSPFPHKCLNQSK